MPSFGKFQPLLQAEEEGSEGRGMAARYPRAQVAAQVLLPAFRNGSPLATKLAWAEKHISARHAHRLQPRERGSWQLPTNSRLLSVFHTNGALRVR